MGVEISDVFIMLKPPAVWRFDDKETLLAAVDEALQKNVPGAIFSYSQPIELRVSELISGVRSDVAVHIYGDDLNLMKVKADEVVKALNEVPGASEAKAEQTVGLPMLRIRIDRRAIARYGLNAEDVLSVVEGLGGKVVGTIFEGQQRFDLQVRFSPEARRDPEAIRELRVAAPGIDGGAARFIPLSQLAEIEVADGPAQISRDAISRRINVEVNVRGRDLASFVAEARATVEREVKMPPGWVIEWGGQFENLEAASARLSVLVPMALLLIFVLLYTAFNSTRLAFLIFLNVPLAITGGLVALALRGYPLSISAGVGFIALFGVAVLNGVVLISYVVQLQEEGKGSEEAAREGAHVRLRQDRHSSRPWASSLWPWPRAPARRCSGPWRPWSLEGC